MLELMDIHHITSCKHCTAQQLFGTIYCSCRKLIPNLNPKIKQDTQNLRKTGMPRGIRGGGKAASQYKHAARSMTNEAFKESKDLTDTDTPLGLYRSMEQRLPASPAHGRTRSHAQDHAKM